MSDRESNDPFDSAQGRTPYLPGLGLPEPRVEAPDWREEAYRALARFVVANPGKQFLSEDFRESLPEGFPQPLEPRKWGVVLMDAARDGWIKQVGFKKIRGTATTHARPMTLWMSTL